MSEIHQTPPPSADDEALWNQLGTADGARPWQIGEIVEHRWFVHRRLQSRMGVIYFCFDMAMGTPIVAKSVPPRYLLSRRARARFAGECELWGSFGNHPNIVHAFFVEPVQSVPHIFIEWIVGVDSYRASVADWIKTDALRVDDAVRIGADVCKGFIHISERLGVGAANFAHRDLKPSNILLNERGVAKLTDFGLAIAVQQSDLWTGYEPGTGMRRGGLHADGIAGTPPYMAPEQCRADGIVDQRSDVYSFGCVLYEMLTGQRLFDVSSEREWLEAHQKRTPPSLDAFPNVPVNLRALVAACLEKDPLKRPQGFGEIKAELERAGREPPRQSAAPTALDSANELMNKGTSLDSLGKADEAIQFFAEAERLLEGSPSDAHLQYSLAYNRAIALENASRFDDALSEWDRATKLFTRITKSGERVQGTLPVSKAHLLVQKSKTLNRMARTGESIKLCKEALRLEPDLYEAIRAMAVAYGFAEQWNEAIGWNDRALAIQPADHQVLSNKAWALWGLSRYSESMNWYDRVLAVAPAHPEALYGKGSVFLFQERLDEAELWLRKAVDANPKYSAAWNHLGLALLKAGRPEAEECFAKALEADPSNTAALRNLVATSSRGFVRVIIEAVSAGGGTIDVPPFALTDEFLDALNGCLDGFRQQTGQEWFFIRRLIPEFRQVRKLRTRSVDVIVTVESAGDGMQVNARVGYVPDTGR